MSVGTGFVGRVSAGAAAALSVQVVLTGVRFHNLTGNATVYIALTSAGATAAAGYPIEAGQSESFDTGWFGGNLSNIYTFCATPATSLAYWGV